MPKEIPSISALIAPQGSSGDSEFLKAAKEARIIRYLKNNKWVIKFKFRRGRYLETLVMDDPEKAEKLKRSLPPGLIVVEINEKKKKKK